MFLDLIPYELFREIARFLKPCTLYCFYLAMLDFPVSKGTLQLLENLIVNLAREKPRYTYLCDGYEQHKEVLQEFCSLRKSKPPCSKISSSYALQWKSTNAVTTDYARRVREIMLPLYIQTVHPEGSEINCSLEIAIRVSSLPLVQKLIGKSSLKEKVDALSCLFSTGDRELIICMLGELFRDSSVIDQSLMYKLFKTAVSENPARENLELVLSEFEKKYGLSRKGWLGVVAKACCRKSKDASVLDIVLPRIQPLNTWKMCELFQTAVLHGNIRIIKKLEHELNPVRKLVFQKSSSLNSLSNQAAKKESLEEFLYAQGLISECAHSVDYKHAYTSSDLMHTAMRHGNLSIVKYLHETYRLFSKNIVQKIVKKCGIIEAIDYGHVECVRYFFDQVTPGPIEVYKNMLDDLSLKYSNVETQELLYQRLISLFTRERLEKMIFNSVFAKNLEVYIFYRNKFDLSSFGRLECRKLMKKVVRIYDDLILPKSTFRMFLQVKLDLQTHVTDFHEWWPEIQFHVFSCASRNNATCIIEYYVKDIMTQAQIDCLFLTSVTRKTSIRKDAFKIVMSHASNVEEALKVAIPKYAKRIREFLSTE